MACNGFRPAKFRFGTSWPTIPADTIGQPFLPVCSVTTASSQCGSRRPLFQWLSLTAALFLLRREGTRDHFVWLLAALTLTVWMFPRHKLFDIGVALFLITSLTLLVVRPQPYRYFLAGFTVGLAAVFGRNHGLYGAVSLAAIMVFLWAFSHPRSLRSGLKDFAIAAAGVIAGYLPVLVMLLFVPGFAQAFWSSILFLFEIKATNLALPVPWPWHVNFSQPPMGVLRDVLLGLFFVGLAVFSILAPLVLLIRGIRGHPISPLHLTAAFLSLPYAHFAFSRADASHLAQGIFPALIGILAIIAIAPVKIRRACAIALCGASLVLMLPRHPLWQCRIAGDCVTASVAGDPLLMPPGTAAILAFLTKLKDNSGPSPEPILVLPFWPGANAILEQKAPVWGIYALFPRTDTFQRAEIARIEQASPYYAVILDHALDGREDLRFRNTNPLIQQYISENFKPLKGNPNWPHIQLYEAR